MTKQDAAMTQISLSDVLQSINDDLVKSASRREEGFQPLFEIESAEVELSFQIAETLEAEGGVKAYVVSFGAKGTTTKGHAHKIKLRLSALSGTARNRVAVEGDTDNPLLRGTR